MSDTTVSPYKRHKTRTPGIYYRLRSDGRKTYSVHAGNGKFVSAASEEEAKTIQAGLRTKKARGEKVVINSRTTFAQLAEEWLELRKKSGKRPLRPRTADYYRAALDTVLLPRFGSWRLTAIDAEAISQLTRDLEQSGLHSVDRRKPIRPLGRSSIDNYLKPLQGTLKLAVRRRLIQDNPFTHLTDDDRPAEGERRKAHEWTDEELDALFAASRQVATRPDSRHDYTPLLRLTSQAGLRLGEVLGLRWEDFDKAEGTLSIRCQWLRTGEYGPTKTEAGVRDIFLSEEARRALIDLRLVSRFSQDEHPIFASRNGTPLGHRNVTKRGWEPARDIAGLPDVDFHDLRHAAASRLIASGIDDAMIADQLGHEDSNITRRVYAHVYDRQKKAKAVKAALSAAL